MNASTHPGEASLSYQDPTYVIFDGDNDRWAYAYIKGWVANDRVAFDFRDAHDLTPMTGRAQDEEYVKGELRKRMKDSAAALVLLGGKTQNLYRYVRWEIELAQQRDLPIIIANLNNKRGIDRDLCPAILRDYCAVHLAFKMKIIQKALNEWPSEYKRLDQATRDRGARNYNDSVYQSLGL